MRTTYHLIYIIPNDTTCEYSKQGKYWFINERHAVSHTIILNEDYIEPVSDVYGFTELHVCLHPNFNDLVDNYKQKDEEAYSPPCVFILFQFSLSF